MYNYVVLKRSEIAPVDLTEIIAVTDDYELALQLAEKFKDMFSDTEIKTLRNAEFYLRPVWNVWLDGDAVLRVERIPPNVRGVYDIIGKIYTTGKGKMSVHVTADSEADAIARARALCAENLK